MTENQTPTPTPSAAEALARVTGSVAATVRTERREADGSLTVLSEETWSREEEIRTPGLCEYETTFEDFDGSYETAECNRPATTVVVLLDLNPQCVEAETPDDGLFCDAHAIAVGNDPGVQVLDRRPFTPAGFRPEAAPYLPGRGASVTAPTYGSVAWDRAETAPCERGTDGCSRRHVGPVESECETW